MRRECGENLWYLCAGFLSSGISCSLYVSCGLGADAFNLMTQGISQVLEISVGNAFYVIQGTMLLAVFLLRRREIGLGTLLGTFLVGAVMNLWSLLLTPLLDAAAWGIRFCCLLTAPAFTGLGISLVKHSGFGLTPCDILAQILHDWSHGLQFRTVRIFYDGVMFLTGLLLGGTAGIGTVLSVLLTGPCIQTVSGLLSAHTGRRVRQKASPQVGGLDHT